MKVGFQISSAWICCLVAGFLMQQIATVSAIYSMEQTCTHVAETYVADQNDCQSFGYCANGTLMGTSSCPKGYIYNARKAICDLPSPDGCTVTNVANACKYAADRSFVPDPTNCNRYFYCNNKVAEERNCKKYQVFDSQKLECVWANDAVNNCPANSVCRLLPDGIFAGDPVNCGEYLSCVGGMGRPGKCPDNYYFNKKIEKCQLENPCETPTPVGIGLGVLTPLPSNPAACKTLKGPFPQYVADGKTCIGFYRCESATGSGAWDKCPLSTHFGDGICSSPLAVKCKFDRCGNMEQQFMGAVGTNCRNYLICSNQTSQSIQSGYTNYVGIPCSNNQFFNEYAQRCEDTSPSSDIYKLCGA